MHDANVWGPVTIQIGTGGDIRPTPVIVEGEVSVRGKCSRPFACEDIWAGKCASYSGYATVWSGMLCYKRLFVRKSASSTMNVLSKREIFSSVLATCLSIAALKSSLTPLFTPRVTVLDCKQDFADDDDD